MKLLTEEQLRELLRTAWVDGYITKQMQPSWPIEEKMKQMNSDVEKLMQKT